MTSLQKRAFKSITSCPNQTILSLRACKYLPELSSLPYDVSAAREVVRALKKYAKVAKKITLTTTRSVNHKKEIFTLFKTFYKTTFKAYICDHVFEETTLPSSPNLKVIGITPAPPRLNIKIDHLLKKRNLHAFFAIPKLQRAELEVIDSKLFSRLIRLKDLSLLGMSMDIRNLIQNLKKSEQGLLSRKLAVDLSVAFGCVDHLEELFESKKTFLSSNSSPNLKIQSLTDLDATKLPNYRDLTSFSMKRLASLDRLQTIQSLNICVDFCKIDTQIFLQNLQVPQSIKHLEVKLVRTMLDKFKSEDLSIESPFFKSLKNLKGLSSFSLTINSDSFLVSRNSATYSVNGGLFVKTAVSAISSPCLQTLNVSVSLKNVEDNGLIAAILGKNVSNVHIGVNMKKSANILLPNSPDMKNLKNLSLKGCSFVYNLLPSELRNNLEEVILDEERVGGVQLFSTIDLLKEAKELKRLSYRVNEDVFGLDKDKLARILFEMVNSLNQLEKINLQLEEGSLGEAELNDTITALKANRIVFSVNSIQSEESLIFV